MPTCRARWEETDIHVKKQTNHTLVFPADFYHTDQLQANEPICEKNMPPVLCLMQEQVHESLRTHKVTTEHIVTREEVKRTKRFYHFLFLVATLDLFSPCPLPHAVTLPSFIFLFSLCLAANVCHELSLPSRTFSCRVVFTKTPGFFAFYYTPHFIFPHCLQTYSLPFVHSSDLTVQRDVLKLPLLSLCNASKISPSRNTLSETKSVCTILTSLKVNIDKTNFNL